MKKTILIAFCFCLFLISSCDFVRGLAGMPTSKEIAAKKELIEIAEAKKQKEIDSLKAAQKAVQDSLALLDLLKTSGNRLIPASDMGVIHQNELQKRYYIIVGAFSSSSNANKLLRIVEKEGYEAIPIKFKNGFTSVGVCPSDKLAVMYDRLNEVKKERFCPDGVWILVKE